MGRAGKKKGKERERVWRVFFFLFFFKPISNQFQTLLNSKLFHKFSQLFLRIFTSILRLLKPHHSQNSCIQIMMHKHLLLLNY
jgi:hypothetical protein